MGLLDNINKTSRKLNSRLGSVSSKIDGLLSVAKGVLCLPTMIAGFISSIPNIINNTISGVQNAIRGRLSGSKGIASNIARDALRDEISSISGIFGAVAGAINTVLGFVSSVKSQVDDILNFIPNKDNCNFSGAAIDKCIVQQSLNGVRKQDLRDAASGLVSVNSLVNKTTRNLGDPSNIVSSFANKQIAQLQRAQSVITKASRII